MHTSHPPRQERPPRRLRRIPRPKQSADRRHRPPRRTGPTEQRHRWTGRMDRRPTPSRTRRSRSLATRHRNRDRSVTTTLKGHSRFPNLSVAALVIHSACAQSAASPCPFHRRLRSFAPADQRRQVEDAQRSCSTRGHRPDSMRSTSTPACLRLDGRGCIRIGGNPESTSATYRPGWTQTLCRGLAGYPVARGDRTIVVRDRGPAAHGMLPRDRDDATWVSPRCVGRSGTGFGDGDDEDRLVLRLHGEAGTDPVRRA